MRYVDAIENELRAWGRSFGEAPPAEWDEDSSEGSGALTGVLISMMRVGLAGGAPQSWAHRPNGERQQIACKDSEGGVRPWLPDLRAEAVERAWLELYRKERTLALLLRAEYCTRGRQSDKLNWANRRISPRVPGRYYRRKVNLAREIIAQLVGSPKRVAQRVGVVVFAEKTGTFQAR